jgi:hypothetical protein
MQKQQNYKHSYKPFNYNSECLWFQFFNQKTSRLDFERRLNHAQVAHTCKHSYSGSRDQEDHGSKPAQASQHISFAFQLWKMI